MACSLGAHGWGDDGSQTQLLKLTQTCALNSECEEPLVCAFERCHVACETDRDCEGQGGRCVRTDDGEGRVCQFEDNVECERDKDCEGKQICAVDGTCRDLCDGNAECGEDQICAENDNVCAQSQEVNDEGNLSSEPHTADDTSNDADASGPSTETATTTSDVTDSEVPPAIPDAGGNAPDASLPATTDPGASDTTSDAGATPATDDESSADTDTDEPDWVEPTECIERGNVGLHFSFQQLVQLPEASAFATDDFTWELWARFASVDTGYCCRRMALMRSGTKTVPCTRWSTGPAPTP